MNRNLINLLVIISILSSTSCVSKKKYLNSTAQLKSCEEREIRCNKDLNDANSQITNLKTKTTVLEKDINNLSNQNSTLKSKNQELQGQLNDISSEALSQQQKMDAAMKKKIAEIEKREKSIMELENLLTSKDQAMRSLLENIEKALKQYTSDELSINLIDGKVYVAMSDKLLFKSGSAKVETAGKEALAKLAEVLIKNPDLNIEIEGHTDNVPISTDRFTDNWDLSVIRATSVVRILVEEYKLNPLQITPSGKGEYYPKSTNETPEGRAINRRTEIIIAPRLDEIFQLLKK